MHGQNAGYIRPQEQHVVVYQVRYVPHFTEVPHFTPLGGACMSIRAATFDMQRISAAMTGGTCRKRRPNLTCTRFAESEQQVYRLIPSISPCCRRHRREALVVFHLALLDPAMQTESWCSLSIRETPAISVNRMKSSDIGEPCTVFCLV